MRFHPCTLVLAAFLGLHAAAAAGQAELMEIAWDADGGFQRQASLAPGRFLEVCGKLPATRAIDWRFAADGTLDFNIHYHVGKQVHYPAQRKQVAKLNGRLNTQIEQDYCWMWSNRSASERKLELSLHRPESPAAR